MAAGRWRLLLSPPTAEEEEEIDHISHLPDAIIHHIFSFLPFKDLVKTSVLSKQWRSAWTSTPYIDLSAPSKRFVPSISRALSLCTAAKIEKFHLDAAVSGLHIPTEPDRWFGFAVARKVEDASLVFRRCYGDVPRILYECASLVSLRVSNCRFARDITIHWPSLKKLCIDDLFLEKDQIMKILSGCPRLESLTLGVLPLPGDLRIDSRSLRELGIEFFYIHSHDVSLEISAPNLLSLRLSGLFVLTGFGLNTASSLAEAELNFDRPTDFRGCFPDRLKFLLEQLQHVAKITIGSWCLEVLSAANVKGTSSLSSRWRDITVHTTVCKRDLLGMAYLLRSSPFLERLVIWNSKSNTFMDFPKYHDFDERQFWHSQKEFYCVANHLKRVGIVGFEFDSKKAKLLRALVKFLLEETVGLEKMIIDAGLRKWRRGVPIDSLYLIQLQELTRRVSKNAKVIVNYRFNKFPYESCKPKQNHSH